MNKILIVDDEPNIVMALEYGFKKAGFEVFIARDGTEAIDIAEAEKPEAILLDIMMPKLDGYQTIQELKAKEQLENTKIVFLSAKNKTEDIERGLSLGADDYITKPFSVKKVTERIIELIK